MSTAEDLYDLDSTPRKRRRWPWIVAFVIVGILVAVVAVAGFYLLRLQNTFDANVEKLPAAQVFPTERPRPTPATPDSMNILMLGSDSRSGLGGGLEDIRDQRADTIMLLHVPGDRSGVQLISIMRDNWVEIPGQGTHKINAALALGGVPLLVETIEGILDVPIDHVAITDFEGFKGLTGALDGVTVNNQIAFSSDGFDYAEGRIDLRDDAALSYVRARYPFTNGDYQRVRNQQAFLKGVVDKLVSRDTLTNPGRVAAAVEAFSPFLSVDAGLDTGTLASLGLGLRSMDKSEILFFTSPNLGTGTSADGQSIVLPDWDGLADLSAALKNDTVPEYYASTRSG